MNAMSPVKNMVLNLDMVTYRYPGVMQYPMDREHQQHAGLVAKSENNKSIHPFGPSRRSIRRRAKKVK